MKKMFRDSGVNLQSPKRPKQKQFEEYNKWIVLDYNLKYKISVSPYINK